MPYPNFPESPDPGDTFEDGGTVFTYLGDGLGWTKTVIHRDEDYPIWGGQMVNVINFGNQNQNQGG